MTETFETIRYTADVVCVRGDDVLLIERGWPPHQGRLALPGGHVDPGETARAAAARELLEETGVRVNAGDLTLVGVYDAPDRDPRGRYVTAAYRVVVPHDATARAGDDAAAVRWVPLDTLDGLAFDHDQIVAAARRQATTTGAQPLTPAQAPALNSPALAVACPTCSSAPGALCTSHGGTRTRRHDVHQARTAVLRSDRR